MRRLLSRLPLAALAVLATWPLLRYGPPSVVDGPLHFYRFVELDWHVRHGDLYPRWFADLHYGFGAPLLNFVAPLAYYVPVGLHLLGFSAPTAYLLGYVFSVVVAILGMYLWARDQFDAPLAGLTAAAAYTLTPYFYFNILGRGSYTEMWALAFAPWVFWSILRLVRSKTTEAEQWGRPFRGVSFALTLSYAALLLSHNITALVFTFLIVLYGLVTVWEAPADPERPKIITLARIGLGLAYGLGLAAFYLLPFVLETSYVQLGRVAELYDYHYFFLSPSDLFSRPIAFDPDMVRQVIPISLPWPQLALALVGLSFSFTAPRHASARTTALGCLLLAGLAFLTQRAASPLWEAVPSAHLVQHPWRLVGPATCLLAWLAGAGIARLPPSIPRPSLTLAALAGFFFFSLTWTYHENFYRFPDSPLPTDSIQYEIANPDLIGTTSAAEYLPAWVHELPRPDALLPRYAQKAVPSRLADLPPGVTMVDEHPRLTGDDLGYQAAEPFTATFNIFYFPGWMASLDGQPVAIRISKPHGLITLDLPAGRHDLRLALRPTPIQAAADLISLLALLLLFFRFPRRAAPLEPAPARPWLSPAWALLFAGLLGLRLLALDRVETIFWHMGLDSIPNPMSVNFDDQLELIGFAYPQGPALTSGGALNLTLYWRARQPLTTDYHTTVRLVDGYGNSFAQQDSFAPGALPTSHWVPGKYARDEHRLVSLPGMPPGEYRLLVGVYSGEGSATPLNIRVGPSPAGVDYDLGTVRVRRAQPQPPGSLRLVEGRLLVHAARVGDRVPYVVLWHSGEAPLPPLTAHLTFTAADGHVLFAADLPPARPDYPTDQWTPNELVRYQPSVILPSDLPAGPAQVALSLVGPDQTQVTGSYDLGLLDISVPERSFSVPPMAHVARHDFNGAIRLLGYDVSADAITLYWQSLQAVPTQLTVFVHRFDSDGTFVAGHDSPPPRPTTSWLPGEVLSDVHPLAVGDYFEVGLYNPETGERFGAPFVVHP